MTVEGEERLTPAKQMENVNGKDTFRKLSEYICTYVFCWIRVWCDFMSQKFKCLHDRVMIKLLSSKNESF